MKPIQAVDIDVDADMDDEMEVDQDVDANGDPDQGGDLEGDQEASLEDSQESGMAESTSDGREDLAKEKRRAPSYWSQAEKDRFIECLQLIGKDWSKLSSMIGTKTSVQVRSIVQFWLGQGGLPSYCYHFYLLSLRSATTTKITRPS